MKRLGLLVIVAALAAVGVLYGLRRAERTPNVIVAALLPRGTVALAHLPDFKRTRDEWHESDLYKLYREPAVQEFLTKPLSKVSQRDTTSQILSDIERLDAKDAFVAVTSIDNSGPHVTAGFRFRGSQAEAEKIIGNWRSHLVRDASVHESQDYEKHKIDIAGAAPNQIATVYDAQWFFVSNDLGELKAILDRVDGRAKDRQLTLEADDAFRGAIAHMPASYALSFYAQPKTVAEQLSNVRQQTMPVDFQRKFGLAGNAIEQIRSVCGAVKFDNGKIRDVLFVSMPKMKIDRELTRSSLNIGTADTFLYVATLLDPNKFAGISESGSTPPLGSWLQKVIDATARTGVTIDDWRAAFDLEMGALADWPQRARWPSIVATLPVKDLARAYKIVDALTKTIDEDVPWTKEDKDGVRYYYMQSPATLFAITPTIAVSNKLLITGLDSVSVEAAMKQSEPGRRKSEGDLASSAAYKSAARAIPTPKTAFAYVDTGLLYSRLDAALRPMLLMSAAFMPSVSDYVDVTKLPPPETVTKHLSPIVSAQRYDGDGYVTESTGPVTLSIGLGLPAVVWALDR
jgi:hypothetical protein